MASVLNFIRDKNHNTGFVKLKHNICKFASSTHYFREFKSAIFCGIAIAKSVDTAAIFVA